MRTFRPAQKKNQENFSVRTSNTSVVGDAGQKNQVHCSLYIATVEARIPITLLTLARATPTFLAQTKAHSISYLNTQLTRQPCDQSPPNKVHYPYFLYEHTHRFSHADFAARVASFQLAPFYFTSVCYAGSVTDAH